MPDAGIPIRLLPFEPRHAAGLSLPEALRQSLASLGGAERLARAYASAGPAWTLVAGDWPLVCGGAVRFWPGTGELWCWVGDEAAFWGLAFARRARSCVDALFAGQGFHRLQAHVREEDGNARRFARFLGLAQEGRCPGYGPDQETHILYGRYSAWKA